MVKNPPTNARNDPWVRGSIPGSGVRSLGQEELLEKEMPLQYSYLGNPTDRGAWWAMVHGASKNQTLLND